MKLRWIGGPLDGCVDEQELTPTIWLGPDPSEPMDKAIAYVLQSEGRYVFSQQLSEKANELIRNRWN